MLGVSECVLVIPGPPLLIGRNRWRVLCSRCDVMARLTTPGDYRRAAEMLRTEGWAEAGNIWRCPRCR